MTVVFERDRHGNPICGEGFMAGTICTRAPHTEGNHAAYCQNCTGDWMLGTCDCGVALCRVCEARAYDYDDGYPLCEECNCQELIEVDSPAGRVVRLCCREQGHAGAHLLPTSVRTDEPTDEEIREVFDLA